MAKKKKYYAIRKGHETGIFDNWTQAQKLIVGFSGTEYKSFTSLEEAQEYLNSGTKEIEDNTSIPTFYIDGSYNSKEEIIGWGYADNKSGGTWWYSSKKFNNVISNDFSCIYAEINLKDNRNKIVLKLAKKEKLIDIIFLRLMSLKTKYSVN